LKCLVKKYTQDFALGNQRHVSHLIDEQGSAMGFFQGPYPLFNAGCGLNAEQFFFHALWRHCGGTQGHKGTICPTRKGMKHARGKLLASAHVATDQNAAVCRGNFLQKLALLAHGNG
jgi:hypothetical protein